MTDPIRESFEKWVNNPYILHRDADNAHDYEHPWTRAAWAAWRAAQPKWQPIETAPSGCDILVTNGDVTWIDWKSDGAFWQQQDDATHWMPLPEPPRQPATRDASG